MRESVVKKGKRSSENTPPFEEAELGLTDDGGSPAGQAGAPTALGEDTPEAAKQATAAFGEGTPQATRETSAAFGEDSPEAESVAWPAPAEAAQQAAPPIAGMPAPEQLNAQQLISELERARSERQEFLDGWQRARAEFANYRKRMERDQEEVRTRIAGETLLRVLGILDDLDRALKDRPMDGEAASWAEGIELIYRKFQALLEAEGVQPILAEGLAFNPAQHEALSHEESEGHEEGQVIEVVQRGYRIGDRVLRPALVRVAK
jgi:molecular chaperone GrpE